MLEVLGLGNKRKQQIKRVVRLRKGVADSKDLTIENKTCRWHCLFFPFTFTTIQKKKKDYHTFLN